MIRTQIQLTAEQLKALKGLAREEERSVADLVRESVAEYLVHRPRVDRAERVHRARSLIGRYHSDCPDLAEHHDDHLDDAFDH
ncbi:MAG: ribbon-helix-helix domain-containing protein [Gammaproteobacteria bacterium]|nr:ribbon-helix-helix domain-containing protein [Gammaproteobacteria bacterium]MDE0052842.1 ribbon-helix-helix domain-containing protein [Gammaproteobacteria bacterium]MDE0226966.1 ribbon-helix-helix domain-containing protein [Gammaproteobacteria bacterium]MDE0453257.1 ribbon-helix-helix domain-containing protein [Gammaproteobacteria bacterium]